jgi:serine/threonine-protein kinase
VPEGLEGGTYDAAAKALQAAGLKAHKVDEFSDSVGAGKVIELRPAGGSQAARGSSVDVIVSKGPDLVVVPKVDGLTLDQAIAALERTGLVVGEVSGPAKGRPFVTDPLAGQKVKRGSTVDIYLRR